MQPLPAAATSADEPEATRCGRGVVEEEAVGRPASSAIGGVTTACVHEAVGATKEFCERNDDPWIGLTQIGNDGAPRADITATTAASAAADAANAPCQSRGCSTTNPGSFVCAMQRN
jgi:hypothetical protein